MGEDTEGIYGDGKKIILRRKGEYSLWRLSEENIVHKGLEANPLKGHGGGEGPQKTIRTVHRRRQDLKARAGLAAGPVPQQPRV